MILASLLHESRGEKYILQAVGAGKSVCFPEREDTTDAMVARLMGLRIKQRFSRVTVRKWFRARFFYFRMGIRSKVRGFPSWYTIGDESVGKKGAMGSWSSIWKFGESLVHPFSREGDPFLKNLHIEPLFTWRKGEIHSLEENQLYCPYDGPVQPVIAQVFNKNALLRRPPGYVCPCCLGNFDL